MKVTTDDAAQRAEFIWLGPVNSPWPFEARGKSWLRGLILCPIGVVLAFILIPGALLHTVLPGPLATLTHLLLAAMIGVGCAIVLVRWIGRRDTPVTPMRHHVQVLRSELTAPREDQPVVHRRVVDENLWVEESAAHRSIRRITVPPLPDDDEDAT